MKRQPRSSPHSAKAQRTVSIIGTGSYVPDKVLTNADLSRMVDTSDEWITTRTGIKERRIAAKDEQTSDMAAKSALKAIEQAKISPAEIDLILVATATPDMLFPATACFVQKKIGASKAACLDISAACAGFLFGIEIAQQFGGGSRCPITRENAHMNLATIHMTGKEVYKQAVTAMISAAKKALEQAGLSIEDISCVIPHQANLRIIEAIADRLKIPVEKFYVNLDKYGNTSAAAVAIALDEANRSGRIKAGDYVLMVVFGGGLTWASTVIEW